jgi:hypothetical protein
VQDHTAQLQEIQRKLLLQVEEALEPVYDEEGNIVRVPTVEDRKLALMVLKHNGITSSITESEANKIRAKIAGRIDSSRISDKRRLVALPTPEETA